MEAVLLVVLLTVIIVLAPVIQFVMGHVNFNALIHVLLVVLAGV